MTIFMCNQTGDFWKNTIVITNRGLVEGDYIEQIKRVVSFGPCALILREKELAEAEYEQLAGTIHEICENSATQMFVHTSINTAINIGCRGIHLSVANIGLIKDNRDCFDRISIACHSLDDVKRAIAGGATQIVLGTIFETDCKKGLKGKGVDFVREITDYIRTNTSSEGIRLNNKNGDIPVYAIGGISPDNLRQVMEAGAAGGCMMSYVMKC